VKDAALTRTVDRSPKQVGRASRECRRAVLLLNTGIGFLFRIYVRAKCCGAFVWQVERLAKFLQHTERLKEFEFSVLRDCAR
jgi:hypothetical protein